MKVREKMIRDLTVISANHSLKEAYDLMQEQEVRHLPIVENMNLIGILSERDILAYSTFDGEVLDIPDMSIYDVMTTNVITCTSKTNLLEAARLLLDNKINCLPVIGNNKELIGMITTDDILNVIFDKFGDLNNIEFSYAQNINQYNGKGRDPRPWANL